MGASRFPDLEQLRLAATVVPNPPSGTSARRPRPTSKFLRGPTPWAWLSRAGQLPGRALHVALAIRMWTGIKKTDCIVMPTSTLAEMGVNRHASRRAVRALEQAGLLMVTRRRGRKTRVQVIEVHEAQTRETSEASLR